MGPDLAPERLTPMGSCHPAEHPAPQNPRPRCTLGPGVAHETLVGFSRLLARVTPHTSPRRAQGDPEDAEACPQRGTTREPTVSGTDIASLSSPWGHCRAPRNSASPACQGGEQTQGKGPKEQSVLVSGRGAELAPRTPMCSCLSPLSLRAGSRCCREAR